MLRRLNHRMNQLCLSCLQLQAFFLVADDIMDSSVTRRGQPCWYKKVGTSDFTVFIYHASRQSALVLIRPRLFVFKERIGLDAINDSFLLEASIYRLLRKHCRDQPYYIHLLELFTEVLEMLSLYTWTNGCHVKMLNASAYVSDVFPDDAGPSSGPHDCPSWSY